MNPTQTFDFQVKRLTRDISETLRTWRAKGGEPALPEVAEKVSGWQADTKKLDAYQEANTPAYQSAKRAFAAAWNNRDNRAKAIRSVEDSLEALQAVPEEVVSPVASYTRSMRRSAKSLAGDEQVGHEEFSYIGSDVLHTLHRQFRGFEVAPEHTPYYQADIRAMKADLEDALFSHQTLPAVKSTVGEVFLALDGAMEAEGDTARAAYYFKRAAKSLETIIDAIEIASRPKGYKSALSSEAGVDTVKRAVELMSKKIYGYRFSTPESFLPDTLRAAKALVGIVNKYHDPKASRLASNVLEGVKSAAVAAQDKSIKSWGGAGWESPDLKEAFDYALMQMDDLSTHVRALR